MGKFKKKSFSSSKDEEIEELPGLSKKIDENLEEDDDEEESVPKWYEQFPCQSITQEMPSEDQLTSLRIEAENVLDSETRIYASKRERSKSGSNSAWIKTVMSKGTAKDRVAASVVTIQNAPMYSLSVLSNLVNSVKAAKKKECILIMETLCDLFVEDILRKGVKLRTFNKQPLTKINELTSGCLRSRKQWLSAWMFEEKLKTLYGNFIESVNGVARDTVDTNRIKAVTVLNKLLTSHPEQEQVLLDHLVNKLGDPSQKVVSKVIYCLTHLLRIHPNMKQIVLNEVEKLLFRQHISQRAQYYSICFLSQYVFSNNDLTLARNIINIYFAFFKALIKKGEVDSRMMGALLMGVKRAFPFAKLERGCMTEHLDTLYKLVHLSKINIALHALCLLHEISGTNEDRYFSALYRKLLDPSLGRSCHHAMFVNLLYKAMLKDTNTKRVKAIIKRLFQMCFYFPVPVVSALLCMISQVIVKRKKLLFSDTLEPLIDPSKTVLDDDNDEEVYIDADKEEEDDQDLEETKPDIKEEEDEKKPLRGWVHYEFNQIHEKPTVGFYDPFHRNPSYSKADKTAYVELTQLTSHFHPTVSLFATQISNQETIKYSGDPLADFTLSRFLERFVFKNPKNIIHQDEKRGPDPLLAARKYYRPSGVKSLNVRSANYLERSESDIPVDELFLYRYLKEKHELKKDVEEDDDNDSVASEEFEELLDRMMTGKKKNLDYMEDIGDNLKKKSNTKGKAEVEKESSSEDDETEDEKEDHEDIDMSDIDVDDEDDDEVMDFDDEPDFEGDIDLDVDLDSKKENKSKKRQVSNPAKKKKNDLESLFAPAEEFAEMLEEAGSSKFKQGMHSSVSNKENAAQKQLEWEKKRDMWVRDRGNFKKKRKSGPSKRKPHNFKKPKKH